MIKQFDENYIGLSDKNMAELAEQQADLEGFMESVEGQLVGFTDEELWNEIFRRQNQPLRDAMENIIRRVDSIQAHSEKPF